jgi:tRNA threonylcarbamoyl adenosine modification protein YeaZ
VLAHRVEGMARGQAERLIPLLEELLACAELSWSDIGRIGVGTGPGNFTGIRISVAAARGLALSLRCPAIGVSTLDALADGLARPCLTTVPGRRDTVFVQFHDDDAPQAPQNLAIDDVSNAGFPPAAVCGDMADDVARRTGGWVVAPTAPRAVAIARVAAKRAVDRVERPRPVYLRAADAAPASDLPPPILPGTPHP